MTSLSRRLASCATFALVSVAAVDASAQVTGFAIDRFNPSERGSDWFAEDSLDMRGSARPALGLLAEYADRPLVIVNANGSTAAATVKDQLIVHAAGAMTIADRFRLAFDLPVGAYEDGTAGQVGNIPYAAVSSGGMGDVRLSGDATIVGKYGDRFVLGAGLSIFLPTGSTAAYLGDGQVRLLPRVAVAGDVGIVAYAAHVGFQVRPLDNSFPGYPTGSELDLGGSVGVRALKRRLLVGPEVYASTVVTSSSALLSTRQTPVEGLLGIHYALSDAWKVGGGVATGLTRGFGEPLVRGLLMLQWQLPYRAPVSDRDGDWIPDDVDACPDVPGVRTNDPKTNGCPAPDRDKDGVPDADDACPDVPGARTEDRLTNGCPIDRDHDGIPDADDACPDVAGVKSDDKAANGCPPDTDHDGITDSEDACPTVAGPRTADPKTNGCPDLDRDKDGIPNTVDACPDVAGPTDPDPKRNGCPEAYVQDDVIKVLDAVKFAPAGGIALTDPETRRALEGVLALLTARADVKHVRVEGHTSNEGDAAANRALSARRAEAIVGWLVKKGVARARLTTMGVGGDSPIQDNTTEEGRRANERIELHIEP